MGALFFNVEVDCFIKYKNTLFLINDVIAKVLLISHSNRRRTALESVNTLLFLRFLCLPNVLLSKQKRLKTSMEVRFITSKQKIARLMN